MLPLALYIHWPFCKFKCPYCDFNSHVRDKVNHQEWRDAYKREMAHYRALTGPRKLESIFFGGGTPSLMEPETVQTVIEEADKLWGLPTGTEITLEANPTSVEADKLRGFKAAGVNRVSLGVQSLRDADLKKLGRQHSAGEAMKAVQLAGSIFDRFSFDLIYARPGQTLQTWEEELNEALSYGAKHMSLYQLTIEPGTQYYTLHQRGELVLPPEEECADMYEFTQTRMAANDMPAYEVSNHAASGQESRHNLTYWRYLDYAGIGPGAHGRLTLDGIKTATRAHAAPELWINMVGEQGHGSHPFETIDNIKRGRESLMMGLRLTEGVSLDALAKETHTPLSTLINPDRLQTLRSEGFIELTETQIRATAQGRQRLNAVLSHLFS